MSVFADASLAELAAKVQRLEEERAILRTLHKYGHAIDYGDEAGWLDCFTEDGAFDLHFRRDGEATGRAVGYGAPHAKGVRFEGRAALEHFIARHTRAPTAWHKHLLIEPIIDIELGGARAKVRSYFVRLDEEGDARSLHAFGRYLDDLARGADGVWRFKQRVAEIESMRT